MKGAEKAIIKKDMRDVTSNRRLFSQLWIVPLMLTVVLPSIFICAAHFAPDDPEVLALLELLPGAASQGSVELAIAGIIFNYILPAFFLMIPIMTASIMAASAFVGEKEKHTLETLLYCPLSVKEIFRAKVLASFFLSMLVSLTSFAAMLAVLELESVFLMGSPLLPGVGWVIVLFLLSPAISLIAVTLIVRNSAKAQSVEESQQSAVFLIIPVVLLVVGQFAGVMLLNVWILLGLSVVCALLAWMLLQRAVKRFTYEMLLKWLKCLGWTAVRGQRFIPGIFIVTAYGICGMIFSEEFRRVQERIRRRKQHAERSCDIEERRGAYAERRRSLDL